MQAFHTKLSANGRIVLPAACRNALSLQEGDELIIQIKEGEVSLLSAKQALQKIQNKLQKYTKNKHSVVDDFICERREHAKHE